MPPVVAAALLFVETVGAATLVAVGATSFGVGAAIAAGTLVVAAGVYATQAALTALLPDMSMPQADTDKTRQQTVRGTIEPQKVVYGQALVSGPIFFVGVSGTDNRDLYHGIALTGHECESITDIHFDNEVITNAQFSGNSVASGTFGPISGDTICSVEKKLGSTTQASSSLLTTTFTDWTSANQGKGISYIVTKWTLTDGSQELWDRLKPQNIKALVKGKKDIYDPRLDVAAGNAAGANPTSATYQAWSDNPALCVANFLMDTKFGLGVAASKIDWADVVTAADACDVSVVVPNSGTQKRFTANGVIFATDSYRASLNKLLSSMNGSIFYSNGSYRIKAGVYEAPSISLDEDDLAGSITVKTSVERGERFNTVRPIIIDPAQNHKTSEVPQVQLTSAVSRDNGEVITKDVQLPFTNTSYMAQRIANRQIQLSDQQKVINFPANLSALNVDIGDRVSVTVAELNYSAKVFRCVNWAFSDSQDGAVNLTLVEDDSGSYADPAANEYSTTTADGTITAGFRGVPDPQNLSATAGLKSIELNWTNPVNTSKFKEIVIYASPDSSWANKVEIGRTMGTQFFHDASNGADPLAVGDQRYYWVRAVAYGTGTGSFVESDRNPDNDTSNIQATVGPNNPDYSDIVDDTPAQAAPTNLTLTETTALGNDGSVLPAVLVRWTAPNPNTYVSFYELEFKRTSVGEIDYGDVSASYTSTIDYGSVASGTTTELNYGSVSEAVVGGDAVFSNIAVYGTNTTIAGLVELQEYTFRVKAVTLTGKTSGTISNTLTLQGDNTPPSLPSTVTATGGIQQITLNWENPSDSDFAYVEIFENTVDNQAGSSLVVQTPSDNHTIAGLGNAVTRYYWLRCVDRSGNTSSFTASFNATTQKIVLDDFDQNVIDQFEAGDAFGIAPVTSIAALGTGDHVGQIKYLTTTSTLYVWTGSAWTTDLFTASSVSAGSVTAASFAAGVEPISAVTTLPSPVGYTGPKTVFQTSDAKLYRYDSTVPEFTTLVKTTDLSGTLGDNLFSDTLRPVERVTTLPTTNLETGRVVMLTTDSKLYRYNGTSWTSSIAAADLSDQVNLATQVFGQVQAANITTGQITSSSIQTGAVVADSISSGAISAVKLAADSVTANAIAANAVTASEILANTITSSEINTSEIFADSAVIGAIQASSITTSAVVAAIGTFEFIQSQNIQANAITGGKIAASTITANKLAVTNLAAITADLGTVTAGTINASQVAITNLNADNISTGTINANRLQIDDVTLDTDGAGQLIIKSAGVDSAQIAGHAVTNMETKESTATVNVTGNSGLVTIISDSITLSNVISDSAVYVAGTLSIHNESTTPIEVVVQIFKGATRISSVGATIPASTYVAPIYKYGKSAIPLSALDESPSNGATTYTVKVSEIFNYTGNTPFIKVTGAVLTLQGALR